MFDLRLHGALAAASTNIYTLKLQSGRCDVVCDCRRYSPEAAPRSLADESTHCPAM